MNPPDIIFPDFKFTGTIRFGDESLDIITQRRVALREYTINDPQDHFTTPAMRLSKPVTYWHKINQVIDKNKSELFVAALGRKGYMEEIILCLAMNIPDEYEVIYDINVQIFPTFLKWYKILYDRLSDIVRNVIQLTVGATGSRRRVYQHYFYSNDNPSANDEILKQLNKVTLPSLSHKDSDFQTTISDFRAKILVISDTEDSPVVDLLDLTLEQFNTIMKYLPKDSAWIKSRKERLIFFDDISDDLDLVLRLMVQLWTLQEKYNLLTIKHKKFDIKIEELQLLAEFNLIPKIPTLTQKVSTLLNGINTFAVTYNSSGVLKYQNKTITQVSSLINDLFNSQFIEFIEIFKRQHKRLLIDSINTNLEADVSVLLEKANNIILQFRETRHSLDTYNQLILLITIYKLVDVFKGNNEDEIRMAMQDIEVLKDHTFLLGSISIYFTNADHEKFQQLLTNTIYNLQAQFDINEGILIKLFNDIYKCGTGTPENKRMLTLLSALLPVNYASRFTLTRIINNDRKYEPLL